MQSNSDDIAERLDRLERQLALAEAYSVQAFWRALDVAYGDILKTRKLRCLVCDAEGQRDDFEIVTANCIFGGGVLERYVCPDCDCIFGPQKYLDLDEDFVTLDYRMLYSRYSEGDTTLNEVATFRVARPCPGWPLPQLGLRRLECHDSAAAAGRLRRLGLRAECRGRNGARGHRHLRPHTEVRRPVLE